MKPTLKFLDHCSVVVCAGSGGVGKTTTAAALGIVAARRGRRVAVITIDPARRLADSLGLRDMAGIPQPVDAKFWTSSPRLKSSDAENKLRARPGELVVMTLDTQQTLDSLVHRHTNSAHLRERILGNPLYRHLSTNLPGVPEYMALEKLQELQHNPHFDLVILDTPPSRNAVDFLTAPERLIEALDGKVMQWLTRSLRAGRGVRKGLVGVGVSGILALMGKITGQGLLEQMARLVVDLDEVLGGVRHRAQTVSGALRDSSLQFILVGAPNWDSTQEALQLATFLETHQMNVGAFLVNRIHRKHQSPTALALRQAIGNQLRELSHAQTDALARGIADAAQQASSIALSDERALLLLETKAKARTGSSIPVLWAPAIANDLQGISALSAIADALTLYLRPHDGDDPETAQ